MPLDAASRAAAAVGSSPATETSVDGSTVSTPWNVGTNGAIPAMASRPWLTGGAEVVTFLPPSSSSGAVPDAAARATRS